MIGSAAFAAVLIKYDLMARGRLGDAHSKALGVRPPPPSPSPRAEEVPRVVKKLKKFDFPIDERG